MSISMNSQSRPKWMPLLQPVRNAEVQPLVIRSEGDVICGSGPQAQMRLELQGVEERHCVFNFSSGKLSVKPLDGGVWVNCVEVKKDSPLYVGDHLLVGSSTLRIDSADPATVAPEEIMSNGPSSATQQQAESDDSRRAIQNHMSILEQQLFEMKNSCATTSKPASAPEGALAPAAEGSANDDVPGTNIAAPQSLLDAKNDEVEAVIEPHPAQLAQLDAQLKAHGEKLQNEHTCITPEDESFAQRKADLDSQTSDVESREQELTLGEEKRVEPEARCLKRESDLNEEEEQLRQKRDDIQRERSETQECAAGPEVWLEELNQRQSSVGSCEAELQAQADQQNQHAESLAARDHQQETDRQNTEDDRTQLNALRQEIEQQQQSVQTQAADLERRAKEFCDRQRELDDRQAQLLQAEDTLRQAQAELQRQQEELASQSGEIERLTSENESSRVADEEASTELRRKLEQAAEEISRTTATVESLRNERQQVETERDALQSEADRVKESEARAADGSESLRRLSDEPTSENDPLQTWMAELDAAQRAVSVTASAEEQKLLDQILELRTELATVTESKDLGSREVYSRVQAQDELIDRMKEQLEAAETAMRLLNSSQSDPPAASTENSDLVQQLAERDMQIRDLNNQIVNLEESNAGLLSDVEAKTRELHEGRALPERFETKFVEPQVEAGPSQEPPMDPAFHQATPLVEQPPVSGLPPIPEPRTAVEQPVAEQRRFDDETGHESPTEAADNDNNSYRPGVTHLRDELASLFGLGEGIPAAAPAEPKPMFQPESGLDPKPVPESPVEPALGLEPVPIIALDPVSADDRDGSDPSGLCKIIQMSFDDHRDVLLAAEEEPVKTDFANTNTDPSPAAPGGDESDYVTKYMEELLARNRTGAGESLPSELHANQRRAPAKTKVKAPSPLEQYMSGEQNRNAGSGPVRPDETPQPATARPKFDLEAMRQNMNSFRELSSHSVQNALQSHARKTRGNGIRVRWAILLMLLSTTGFAGYATAKDMVSSPLPILGLGMACLLSGWELKRKRNKQRAEAADVPEVFVAPANIDPIQTRHSTPLANPQSTAQPVSAAAAPAAEQSAYVEYHSR